MTTEERFKKWLSSISITTLNKGSVHCLDRFINDRSLKESKELRDSLKKIYFDYLTPRITI